MSPLANRDGVTVQLQDLQRHYGEVRALDGLTIEMSPGELVTLLGPSGCGKTTALRALAGLERLDGGRVLVDGQDITEAPANRRDMGMVFQAYSLFPHLTARENVEFGLRLRKVGAADRRRTAERYLELVDLAGRGNRSRPQLWGGQQQRVALARALAIGPRVFLLDEPLSALDAKVRSQLRDEIRRIQLEVGITTLYVTHDQEEALSVSDRVAVMSSGRIEQIGTPSEMYSAPAPPFVAEFIGTMNRLEARVVDGATGEVLHEGTRLTVDAARGWTNGERVLVLVRPELLELEPSPDGGGAGENTLTGEVLTHTFLGSVTRLKILGG